MVVFQLVYKVMQGVIESYFPQVDYFSKIVLEENPAYRC